MKPRWKTLIELAVSVVLAIIGANFLSRGLFPAPDEVWPQWLLIGAGLIMLWVNLDRVHDRWDEL